jgi:multimeric flavodoxin WrbA
MKNVLAVNGSPNKEKGYTGLILAAFLDGMRSAGSDVEVIYTTDLDLKPCTGEMYCWYKHPGTCYIKDDMQVIYQQLRQADVLIIATPVYIPLPGKMQIFINRLCPLIHPLLETRENRTRAQFNDDVQIRKFMLVSTGGWWEKENFNSVIRIVEELALNSNVEFSGALIRPHAFLMMKEKTLTDQGKKVIELVNESGREYALKESLDPRKLEMISEPLVSRAALIERYNKFM